MQPPGMPTTHRGQDVGLFQLGVGFAKTHGYGLQVIIAGDHMNTGWEHASAKQYLGREDGRDRWRCPTWHSMTWLRDQLWGNEQLAVQFHVPIFEHINVDDHVLHLWVYAGEIPQPPEWMV